MKRRICPICLAPLDPAAVVFRDPTGANAAGPPARRSTWTRIRNRLLGRPDDTARSMADFYAQGLRAHCPVHQGELPEELLDRDTVIIGLVGESGSSKTHYMASLLHLLSSGALMPYQTTVSFEPGTATRYQSDYYQRMFLDREVIPASRPLRFVQGLQESRMPMTLVLRNWETGRAVNVCLFDAAGEQLLSMQSQSTWARHLSVADGLLFFVDPSVLPGVRRWLGDLGGGQTLHVTESMLNVTASLVRHAKSLSPDDDIAEVPAAMLLAKADAIADSEGFPQQVLEDLDELGEAPYRLFNRLRGDSELVEEYMSGNGGRNLVVSAAHHFPGITFHAVSATGCSDVEGRYPIIEPQRCLEPFLLLLARAGVIDTGGAA